jgi:hypothetical protein
MKTNEQINQFLRLIDTVDFVEVDGQHAQAVHTYESNQAQVDIVLSLLHTDHESGQIYEYEFQRKAFLEAEISGNEIRVIDIEGEICEIALFDKAPRIIPNS